MTSSYRPEVFLPKELPELRRALAKWTRELGPFLWYQQHMTGTHFYIPPGLRAMPLVQAIDRIAHMQADLLDEAKLYSVTPDMTFLAQKTSMPEYELTLETLPSPKGLVVWQQPIGQCENTDRMRLKVNAVTGDIEEASVVDWIQGMGKEDIPVLAASWELLPDETQVMVVFYSSREGLLNNFPDSSSEEELRLARNTLPPMIFEREQLLPIGRSQWFTSEEEDRLYLTASAERREGNTAKLKEMGRKRDLDVLPMMTQMVKTLIATWMLMGMKFTKTDVELPDRHARKRMKREGASDAQVAASGVQVVRIGGPLRTQKPKNEGDPAFRWKKRRIVGPFVRRQWYPSEETHKPKLIEPYIAGPEGAPIGNAEKVYLLSE